MGETGGRRDTRGIDWRHASFSRRTHLRWVLVVACLTCLLASGVAWGGTASRPEIAGRSSTAYERAVAQGTNTTSVTGIANPDAYTCNQPGFVGFESLPDGTNLPGTISGLSFVTTAGYPWIVGDFSTGNYNGKYPSGAYTSEGTHWAWLGPNQGSGRIDFTNGAASYFSLLTSVGASPVYVVAYDSNNDVLATAGPAPSNTNTGQMAEVKITRAVPDMAYVIVHDTGNFFLVDSICTDAPGVVEARTFKWRIQDRWTVQQVRGTDIHVYPTDVAPATYAVDFQACESPVYNASYSWSSSTGVSRQTSACATTLNLPPGTQKVTMTITKDGTVVATNTQTVNVRDILIVSMGDSVASGEGNPDVPGSGCGVPDLIALLGGHHDFTTCNIDPVWYPQYPSIDTGSLLDPTMNQNSRCHRSTWAGVAQFAWNLQVAAQLGDGHYSVSPLHVACSGATVDQGLLGPQGPTQGPTVRPDLLHEFGNAPTQPSQVQQVRAAIGGRTPDALIITVGADDINFSDILTECLQPDAACAYPDGQRKILKKFNKALSKLNGAYDRLAACVSPSNFKCNGPSLNVPPDRVWLTEYFNPSLDDSGNLCDYSILGGLSELTPDVFSWATANILDPLENAIHAAAQREGWHVLSTYNDFGSLGYFGHGICANVNWMNTWEEDFTAQGDEFGFFHPNHQGQADYAYAMNTLIAPTLFP